MLHLETINLQDLTANQISNEIVLCPTRIYVCGSAEDDPEKIAKVYLTVTKHGYPSDYYGVEKILLQFGYLDSNIFMLKCLDDGDVVTRTYFRPDCVTCIT